MMKVFAVAIVALTAAGCGGNSSMMTPSAPSAVSTPAPTTGTVATSNATGTWTGTGTDSSSNALGAGGMIGQAGMGLSRHELVLGAVHGRPNDHGAALNNCVLIRGDGEHLCYG